MKPIGILGGTFDPVHNGHLRLAIEFLERLELAEVRLVPLRFPPHRESPVATPEQRLAMLEIAIENIPGITIDDCELHRNATSYTIDTIREIRKKMGDLPICLLMGMDAFATIYTWRRWKELLEYVHIAIAGRPGDHTYDHKKEVTALFDLHFTKEASELCQSPAGKIFQITMPMLDISATQIRNIILTELDAHGLLPANVLHYILQNKLYKLDR